MGRHCHRTLREGRSRSTVGARVSGADPLAALYMLFNSYKYNIGGAQTGIIFGSLLNRDLFAAWSNNDKNNPL